MNTLDLKDYMIPGRTVHLVGIGGVSMSPLAEVLKHNGMVVQGSDMAENDAVHHLRNLGIDVTVGHGAENIGRASFLIRTAAVHDDNPEIVAANEKGIPVFERAQAWGYLMREYKNALCISGTHGKTTTTSMCTHIMLEAVRDPTVMIGGTLPVLHSGYRIGQKNTIILESCEYCNSFLNFFPTIAVIMNVEEDHLDFFKDLEDIEHSFHRFAELVPKNAGYVIYNADNQGACDSVRGVDRQLISFGVEKDARVKAEQISFEKGMASFYITVDDKLYTNITLKVPGMHNVYNALAAATASYIMGITGETVRRGLSKFTGAARRFQYKGEYHGAAIYDDYAHHPSELNALLTTAKTLGYSRLICAFQPHTYTRTKALFDDFVRELKIPNLTVLGEIYAARETNDIGISSLDLARCIPGSIYCATLESVTDTLRRIAQPGDIILTVGAGNIYQAGENLLK